MVMMKALSTFKGVEGFVCRGNEFETSERRAEVLKRRKLAEVIVPKEHKVIEPSELKDKNNDEKDKEEKNLLDKEKYKVSDLEEVAKLLDMSGYSSLNKDELLKEVSEALQARGINDLASLDKEELINKIKG